LFVGLDWAEDHHDLAVMADNGQVLAARRVPEGLAGQVEDPAEVVVGTETDRGLFVGALVAAGYQVYAVNPLAVSRTATAISPRGQVRCWRCQGPGRPGPDRPP